MITEKERLQKLERIYHRFDLSRRLVNIDLQLKRLEEFKFSNRQTYEGLYKIVEEKIKEPTKRATPRIVSHTLSTFYPGLTEKSSKIESILEDLIDLIKLQKNKHSLTSENRSKIIEDIKTELAEARIIKDQFNSYYTAVVSRPPTQITFKGLTLPSWKEYHYLGNGTFRKKPWDLSYRFEMKTSTKTLGRTRKTVKRPS